MYLQNSLKQPKAKFRKKQFVEMSINEIFLQAE